MTDSPAALLEECKEAADALAEEWRANQVCMVLPPDERIALLQNTERLLRALVAVLHQHKDQETEGDATRMDSTGSSDQHIDAGKDEATPASVSDTQKSHEPKSPLPWLAENVEALGADGSPGSAWGIVSGDRVVVEHDFVGQRDAAYIVTACNSYPALVQALKDCLAHVPESEWVLVRHATDILKLAEAAP